MPRSGISMFSQPLFLQMSLNFLLSALIKLEYLKEVFKGSHEHFLSSIYKFNNFPKSDLLITK